MPRIEIREIDPTLVTKDHIYRDRYIVIMQPKKYRWYNFLFDVFLSAITGGLWLIWIFVREMRNR